MSGELDGTPAVTGRPGIYPMSHEQEALWLEDLFWDGPSRYLEAWTCQLTGQLDIGALEWAISQIVARHEVLRTRLVELDEEPVQVVTGPDPVRLKKLSCPPAELDAELSRIVAEPLDLDEAPIRPWLVCVSPEEFVLVVQLHHVVVDDWSLNIFQRELMHFYTARVRGEEPDLEPLRLQAGEFAVAQRAARLDPEDLAYWRERVQNAPRSCTIPPTRSVSGPGTRWAWDDRLDALEQHLSGGVPAVAPALRGGQHLFEISPELGRAVRSAGRALRTTPFTVFAAVLATLLRQYGEADEVIFCTPVSLRGAADVDGMIGVLTNMQPIRLTVTRSMSFRALANAAKAEILGGLEHRAVPYPTMIRMSRQGTAGAPLLCDVVIVVDDMGWEPFSLPNLTTQVIRLPARHAKLAFHLDLVARDDGGYTGTWAYDAELFDDVTVAGVAGRFTKLLAHCTEAPDEPLGRIPGPADGPCHA
jgi:hypothetical protein